MGIYSKRNALVGYFVLRGLGRYWKRAQHRRRMRALKIAAVVAVLVGILAGAAAMARKHAVTTVDAEEQGEAEPGAEDEAATSGNGRLSAEPAPAV